MPPTQRRRWRPVRRWRPFPRAPTSVTAVTLAVDARDGGRAMMEPDGRRSVRRRRTEPDVQLSFANERTFLAWERTALGLITAGLAITQLLPSFDFPGGRRLIGLPLIGARHPHRRVELLGVAPNQEAMRARPAAPPLVAAADRGDRRVRGRGLRASCWSSSRARHVSARPSPDVPRPSLADERTDLAWNRSGLAILGCGHRDHARDSPFTASPRRRRRRGGHPRARDAQLPPRRVARTPTVLGTRAERPAEPFDLWPLAFGVGTIGVAAFALGLLFPS